MKKHKRNSKVSEVGVVDRLIATSFYAGYFPWGPGTAGAFLGVVLWSLYAYAIEDSFIVMCITLFLSVFFTIISIKPIDRLERVWGPDPSRVVIDETVGVWITLLAMPESREWYYVLAAFILFRAMDIIKPLGCRWIDRNIPGGVGVMADDVLAGVYAGAVLMVVKTVVGG